MLLLFQLTHIHLFGVVSTILGLWVMNCINNELI